MANMLTGAAMLTSGNMLTGNPWQCKDANNVLDQVSGMIRANLKSS
jgi:tagatose-1,6-bisphosphate aldolase non-catalytic subunit AgaZ/GatZ